MQNLGCREHMTSIRSSRLFVHIKIGKAKLSWSYATRLFALCDGMGPRALWDLRRWMRYDGGSGRREERVLSVGN